MFHPLDKDAEVRISERNLTHWFQSGAAIFVTFRTADSMPKEVLLRWERELVDWLERRRLPTQLAESIAHQRVANHDHLLQQFDANQQQEFKRLSDRLFHRSLDECHGACRLRQPEFAKIVGDAIRFHDDDKYDLDRFVVMPNHVHAIVQFRDGADLGTVSESWMRYTARQINKQVNRSGAFWHPEPFDHIIRSPEQFTYLQNYIAENPRKASLRTGEYLFWKRPM